MEAKWIARTLAECFDRANEDLKKENKYAATDTYRSTRNSFIKFFKETCGVNVQNEADVLTEADMQPDASPLACEMFTPATLMAYQEWLRSSRKVKWNTVSTYMRTLQAVYNRSYPPGTPGKDATLFRCVYTRVEANSKRALDKEQLAVVATADFDALPSGVQPALAYFLLLFMLRGMAFIDLAYLRKQDLQGNCITYRRHKTGQAITVRIPDRAMALFEEYRNRNPNSGFLFPILQGKENDCERLYRQYQRALRLFNKRLIRIAALLKLDVRLTSYMPRHTWATLSFYRGTKIGIISKALGHSSTMITETYLKPFENKQVDEANEELIESVDSGGKASNYLFGQARRVYIR